VNPETKTDVPGAERRWPPSLPLRARGDGAEAIILLTEIDPYELKNWAAIRNTAFWREVTNTGVAANSVVTLPPATLPGDPRGLEGTEKVISEFHISRGFFRRELEAWVSVRVSETLFLTPSEFDPAEDWARYGVDSAVALEVLADIEDLLGMRLPPSFAECRDPKTLVRLIAKHVLDHGGPEAWWRSPWVTVEAL